MTADESTIAPTILIVDDQPLNLISAEVALEALEYKVVTASSGEEALGRVLEQDFTLILLDVQMPDLDGYDTARLLRGSSRSRDIPIIFMSAIYNDATHMHRGYALGAADYLAKPFDPVILRAKVRALVSLYLRGQRSERARSLEADRVKDLFLGAISHDLRNPLGAIVVGASNLAAKTCSEGHHAVVARRIGRSAGRMNHILDDILDLTRGQFTNGIPIATVDVDLVEICEGVTAELRAAHPLASIQIDAPASLRGRWDPSRMERVISNLVGNAIHHGAGGAVHIRIRDARDTVLLEVQNAGAPIPDSMQADIFHPFRRGDTGAEGVGLGLYIVREIVSAHGGAVTVRSTTEDGTCFMVRLPKDSSEGGQGVNSRS